MRHEEDGRVDSPQAPLQPFYRRDVEVVRRLVEQKQVWLRDYRLLELAAPDLASRKRGLPRGVRDLLPDVRDLQALRPHDFAAVGLHLASKQLQQRRLPLAVAAGDAGAFPLLDGERRRVQHRRPAEANRHIP